MTFLTSISQIAAPFGLYSFILAVFHPKTCIGFVFSGYFSPILAARLYNIYGQYCILFTNLSLAYTILSDTSQVVSKYLLNTCMNDHIGMNEIIIHLGMFMVLSQPPEANTINPFFCKDSSLSPLWKEEGCFFCFVLFS